MPTIGHGPQLCAGRRLRPHHRPEPAWPGAAVGLPARHGLLEPDAILGGAAPYCAVYPAAEGHVAVGAFEPHSAEALLADLDLAEGTGDDVAAPLNAALRSRSARDGQAWGEELGIPLAEVGRGLCDTSYTRLPV